MANEEEAKKAEGSEGVNAGEQEANAGEQEANAGEQEASAAEEAAKVAKPPAAKEEAKSPATTKETTNAESIKLIGGLVALGSGLLVLALIAGGALIAGTATAEKIAIGAFGVIGTLVGAYFGQKIGSDGSKEATERATQEATKAQIYAAHLPPAEATDVIKLAHAAATGEALPAPVAGTEHGSVGDAQGAGEAGREGPGGIRRTSV